MALAQNLSFILLGEDKSASKAMTGVEKTATVVTGRIGTAFSKLGGIVGGEFGSVLGEVGNGIGEIGAKAAKLSHGLELGGGAAIAAGVALQNFASADKQASDQLEASMTAAGDATSDYKDQIEKARESGQNFAHESADTDQALSILVQSTGSTKKALEQMGVVTDLAAAKHISLQEAAGLVSKILAGSGSRTLTQYGVHLDGVGTKTEQSERALKQLGARLDGQAKASVNNFGAQVDVVRTKIQDWAEQMAGPVGQALTALGGVTTAAGFALDIYRSRQEAAALSALTATAATEAETAAVTGLNVAMDANPIGVVAGALGGLALVAGGVALATTKGITAATTDYTQALKSANGEIDLNIAKTATDALIKDGSLKAAQKLGVSSSLVIAAATNQTGAQELLNRQLQAVTSSLDDQKAKAIENAGGINQKKDAGLKMADEQKSTRDAVDQLSASVRGQSEDLKQTKRNLDLASQALSGYYAAAKGATVGNGVTGLSGVGVKSKKAGGGDVTGGFTLVGENGPEVVGLPNGSHVFPNGQGPTGGGPSGPVFNFNLSGMVGDKAALAKELQTVFLNSWKSGGTSRNEFRKALGV